MAFDISEDLALDLARPVPTQITVDNNSLIYDVAIGGEVFFDASSPETPYQRQTAQYRKDQSDNSSEPGEQSLAGWWLRSQSSFHLGSGISFYEPAQDSGNLVANQTLRFRFADSEGLNVWKPGNVTLLRDTTRGHIVNSSTPTYMRPIQYGSTNGALTLDGGDVDKVSLDITTVAITNKALTSNVATVTTSAAHGLVAGMGIYITGVDSTFNGDYKITAVTTNTISYARTASNVTSTAVTPNGVGKSNVTHFVDYLTGADTMVYAICDDGTNAYWVTNRNTGGKSQMFRKALTLNANDAEESIYVDNAVVTTTAAIEYVKGRLIACINNAVYELNQGIATGTTNLPTALFTHKSSIFTFTSITESPSDVYLAGYDGISSQILKLSVSDTGAIAALTGAVTVADMPRGEKIYSIKYYLGYMLIGTSRGVRVAAVQSDGSLVYGPLLFEAAQPVYGFACTDHYAWCTAKINGDAGLVRIDLGAQIDTLVFAYANDLQAIDVSAECTGVAFAGTTDRLIFSVAGTAFYVEEASTLRQTGFLKTGKIRFNTTENKFFKYVKELASHNGGTIVLATTSSTIATVSAGNGNTDVSIPEPAPTDYKQFVFSLNRDSSDTTKGPEFYGYQIKALPAARKQRLMQFNLYCFDNEKDRNGNRIGYDGRAFERITRFEDIEAASDIVAVQDFRTGETFSGLIEECSFKGMTAPSGKFSGFGGILTVTVRKI
jgi:hypothetical protein